MTVEKNSRSPLVARLISAILHPLIVAPVTFVILLCHTEIGRTKMVLLFGLVIIAIVVVPLLSVVHLKRRGRTASLDVPERANRINPFLISILGYFIVWALLKLTGAPQPVTVLMWIYTTNTAIATFITHYWKISIHGMALGGPIAALGWVVSPGFYWVAIAAPLIVYSRVKLKAHSIAQVICGFLLGFLLTLIQLAIIL